MNLPGKDKRKATAGVLVMLSVSAILTADDELKEFKDSIARRSLSGELDAHGKSSVVELIRTGIVVGILFVFTGPNLAAIATLSGTDVMDHCNEDAIRKRRYGTFMLGIKWGIGNSVGLLFVGGLLIYIHSIAYTDFSGMDYVISSTLQACVGTFSLLLGTYGVVTAMKNREYNELRPHWFHAGDDQSSSGFDSAFERASERGSVSSSGLESAITEVAANIRMFGKISNPDDSSELSEDSATISRADSIVGQMVACLNAEKDKNNDDVPVEKLGLSDFEHRMWESVKTLKESMKAGDDKFSFRKQELDDTDHSMFTGSIHTSTDESLRTIPLNETIIEDSMVPTKHEPEQVPTGGVLKRKIKFKTPKLHRRKPKVKFTYLCENSSLGRCFVCTPGILAVFAGIVRGIASPGEVLSNIQFQQTPLIILSYLASFCTTSTLVMGGFASMYGKLCKWLTGNSYEKDDDALSRVFLVEFGSACLSIVVGIVWLTLLAVGQLDMMLLDEYDSGGPSVSENNA